MGRGAGCFDYKYLICSCFWSRWRAMSDNKSILSAAYFHNEEGAYEFVEARLWPRGPVCPRCGVIGNSRKLQGKSTRIGVYKCRECRKPFTVKVGTIFEDSHIPMNVWLQAIFLVASSKKGVSSNQLHRSLGVTLKSAWFMSHRIREAMREGDLAPFGADGGVVEVDETYIGHDKNIKPVGEKHGRGYHHKNKVLSLVDRNSGQARSFVVDDVRVATVGPIVRDNLAREAKLMTDDNHIYRSIGRMFPTHNIINHRAREYVSMANPEIHTNTIEGFFSVFKRGMKGVYQHCAHNHLHRYLAEFDFRYNNRKALGVEDQQRADKLLKGFVGKRLTYETTTV
jgi:transposase-like protein